VAFTADLVTGVWVGFDQYVTPLGAAETGGKAALPVWLDYMKRALGKAPVKDLLPPPGVAVVSRRIDERTGRLARPDAPNAAYAWFKAGTEPTEEEPEAGVAQPGTFFKMDVDF
jgi:penicillin-binding protein 1A